MHIQTLLDLILYFCVYECVCMFVFANNYYRLRGIINLRVGEQIMSCRVRNANTHVQNPQKLNLEGCK